ncbi:MAG TPA: hypothetical protein VMJ93_16240 [Verrucomicrobiae bacterium]|nr:hypothetical protein [Verrucomicrobiae bacterium]
MEEYPQPQERQDGEESPGAGRAQAGPWIAAIVGLLVVASLAFGYGYRQHAKADQMAAQEGTMHATIAQLQGQIDTLNTKLTQMSEAQAAAAAEAARPPAHPAEAPAHRRIAEYRRHPRTNGELRQLQSQVATQQKQLSAIQDEVAQTRTDLQGNIDSTRDQLNGSIAKNHDQLVALEKRGERNYFEFDLTKSKEFQRSGPLMLSLRKADTKHERYDLAMIVDDNKIDKKHVDLYEPIWLQADGDVQSVQLVVNQIDKNHVHGYISVPKFAEARQASAAVVPASATSVTPPTPAADAAPSSQ